MCCAGQGGAGRCLLLAAACAGCVVSVGVGGWRLTFLGKMDLASDSDNDVTCVPLLLLLLCYNAAIAAAIAAAVAAAAAKNSSANRECPILASVLPYALGLAAGKVLVRLFGGPRCSARRVCCHGGS